MLSEQRDGSRNTVGNIQINAMILERGKKQAKQSMWLTNLDLQNKTKKPWQYHRTLVSVFLPLPGQCRDTSDKPNVYS